MEAQLFRYSIGFFGRTKAPGGTFSQSTSRVSKTASPRRGPEWASVAFSSLMRTPVVAVEQSLPLVALNDAVGLKAPGVETDRQIIGKAVVAGEIEVDQAQSRSPKKILIGKQIGVDDALSGRSAGQTRCQEFKLLFDGAVEIGLRSPSARERQTRRARASSPETRRWGA